MNKMIIMREFLAKLIATRWEERAEQQVYLGQPSATLGRDVVARYVQALQSIMARKSRGNVQQTFRSKVVACQVDVNEAPVSFQSDGKQGAP